jgi:hypothetical protein
MRFGRIGAGGADSLARRPPLPRARKRTASAWAGGSFTGFQTVAQSGIARFDASQPPPVGPPDTVIKKANVNRKKHRATFKFKGTGGLGQLKFKCKLDKKEFKGCSSPKVYKHLREGKHTFKVQGIDSSGQADPTPAKRKFKLP